MPLYVKVPKKQAQKVRNEMLEKDLLNLDYELIKRENHIFFPVKEQVEGFEIVDLDGKKRKLRPRTLKDALNSILTEKELELVPKRFDLIGEVAVLAIPDEIKHRNKEIAEAVVKIHPRIKTVCMETGSINDTFRVKPVEVILGERTRTEYRESGLRMRLDVSSVYFTPRLSSERLRIAEEVLPGERVLVMFAGIGPYALVIAKKQPKTQIIAVEINPDAVKYMKENVLLNKLKDKIEVFGGDVREIVHKLGKFDRILMPLPASAGEFLDIAKKAIKKGGIVHFYSFSDREDPFAPPINRIKKVFQDAEILYKGIVGNISPGRVRVVIDFKV